MGHARPQKGLDRDDKKKLNLNLKKKYKNY